MLNKKLFKLEKKKKSFLSKLYDILNNITYKEIIYWNKEGKGIIIANVNEFSTMILPKYYNHSNFSSFVRQLNLYGFHKSQGIIKEGEGYEHDKLNKNSTIEDFKRILKTKKRKNTLMKYLNKDSKDNFIKIFEGNNYVDDEKIFKYLLEQNENNIKIINESKKEIEKLEKQNRNFYDELQLYKNGSNIILKNIMKSIQNNKRKDKKYQKSKNLGELFTKYLYHLKIYSPFLKFIKDNNSKYKIEKMENLNFDSKLGNELNGNLDFINTNMNSLFNDPNFASQRQDTKSLNIFLNNFNI
jgi:hypothetical protein